MDRPHSSQRAVEKDRIKELLRDAIRILCQNTVSHHTRLSVEALIGITVDDGEDSIVVSINESIDAAESNAYQTEEQYQNMGTCPDYDLQETAIDDNSQFNDTISYGHQYNPSVPYQAVVKKETSVITYNTAPHGTFAPNSITSSQTANQYFTGDGSYADYESARYGHQGAFGVVRGKKSTAASAAQRGRGRGQGAQRAPRQMTQARSAPTVKQEYGGETDTATDSKRGLVDTSEVSHVTLYTCQRCGKQMNNHSSFVRHKKSHLGIVYRCDGCGKILSRSDHLARHRRNCEAALQQAPLDI